MPQDHQNTNAAPRNSSYYASLKLSIAETINADPHPNCGGSEMKVFMDYARFMGQQNPHPFRTMSALIGCTGLSETTIIKARKVLVSLGYMIERGMSEGVKKYELSNPPAAIARSKKSAAARSREFQSHKTAKTKMRKEMKAAKQTPLP